MKKLIIGIIVLGGIGGGYYYVLKYVRAPLSMLQGKTVVTTRGDLEVPITASGHIRPASVTNVKSKASGEVNEIFAHIGDMVTKDQLIIQLDESDEERNVQRADAEAKQAEAAWRVAILEEQEAREVGLKLAAAKVKNASADYTLALNASKAQEDLKARELADGTFDATSQREHDDKKAMLAKAEANKEVAEAEQAQARIRVDMAAQKIASALQYKNAADRTLEEARERLEETSVLAPDAGTVIARHVQKGELVMSGTTSFTGGTVLMEIADVREIYAEVNVDEADIGLVRSLATQPASRPDDEPAAEPTTRPDGEATGQLRDLPEGTVEMGQRVEVTVEAYPEETFYGVIDEISPQSEIIRAIATFKVRIRITSDNREQLKKVLNTQAQAKFTVKSVTNAVLVDYEAMKQNPNGDDYGVYIPYTPPGKSDPEPKFVPCEFGVDNRVLVEVRKGLKEGQKVYTKLPKKTRKQEKDEEEAEESD